MSETTRARVEAPTRLFKYIAERTSLGHRALDRASWRSEIVIARPGGDWSVASPRELVFEGDRVRVGELDVPGARPVRQSYWALHKPAGVISSASDTKGRPDLSPWLGRLPERVHPVGRLDAETTGLILLTDDGDLTHMLLHPEFHARKLYVLDVRGDVPPDDPRLAAMLEGVEIGAAGALARAERVEVVARGPQGSRLEMILTEGKKRQIRRMCRRVGMHLTHLHRVRFGAVELGALAEGELRELEAREVDALWAEVGGRARVVARQRDALVRHHARSLERGEGDPRLEAWLVDAGLWPPEARSSVSAPEPDTKE